MGSFPETTIDPFCGIAKSKVTHDFSRQFNKHFSLFTVRLTRKLTSNEAHFRDLTKKWYIIFSHGKTSTYQHNQLYKCFT